MSTVTDGFFDFSSRVVVMGATGKWGTIFQVYHLAVTRFNTIRWILFQEKMDELGKNTFLLSRINRSCTSRMWRPEKVQGWSSIMAICANLPISFVISQGLAMIIIIANMCNTQVYRPLFPLSGKLFWLMLVGIVDWPSESKELLAHNIVFEH